MRLIDVDELKTIIVNNYKKEFFGSVLWDILNDIPTVYDIDAVVEELEEMKYKTIPIMSGRDTVYARIYDRNTIDKAIEIAINGGVKNG